MGALRALDIHGEVKSAGLSTRSTILLSVSGKQLGKLPIGASLSDGTVSITIRRARLNRVLLEQATASGIAVEFGKRLVSAEASPDGGVIAHFEDGTKAIGDLLIGCDGAHSITRRLIDPAAPAGRYVGLVNFGGYTRGLSMQVEPGVWHMVFGKRAFFGYVIDPTSGIVWFVNNYEIDWETPAATAQRPH